MQMTKGAWKRQEKEEGDDGKLWTSFPSNTEPVFVVLESGPFCLFEVFVIVFRGKVLGYIFLTGLEIATE